MSDRDDWVSVPRELTREMYLAMLRASAACDPMMDGFKLAQVGYAAMPIRARGEKRDAD